MGYLLALITVPTLALGAVAFAVAAGRRLTRAQARTKRTLAVYARTAHDPGQPLPPTRHPRPVRVEDRFG